MKTATLIARLLFGLCMFANGVNYFLPFFPLPQESAAGLAFRDALVASGVFAVVKVMETVLGLAFLLNIFVPAAICMTMPISVIIFINDIYLERTPPGYVAGTLVLLVNLFLMYRYWRFFGPFVALRAAPDGTGM